MIALACCQFLLNGQAITFSRTYGGQPYDDIRSTVATPDGGFVFTGLHKNADDPDGTM